MNHSPEIDRLATALSAAQREFSAVEKDGTNPHFRSKFASLANVVKTAMPVLTQHGLSVSQDPEFDGTNDLLTTTVMHSSGQWKTATMRLHPVKQDPQSQGSALTYAKRYSLMATLGLVADDDDDGQATYQKPEVPTGPPQTPPPGGWTREEMERRRLEAMEKAKQPKDGEPF